VAAPHLHLNPNFPDACDAEYHIYRLADFRARAAFSPVPQPSKEVWRIYEDFHLFIKASSTSDEKAHRNRPAREFPARPTQFRRTGVALTGTKRAIAFQR